jgi:hypothetical protein
LAARNAGHAPQTCAHVQLAVERRSRGRKGEIPQPRHPGVALSQTRGRRGSERFRARQSTLRQSPHPAPAPVGRHGSLYGCRHSPAERKRAWGCPIVKTRRSAQPGLPEWHAERGSACRCERPALRAGERYTAACTNVRWQPPPAAGSLTERRWQPPAGRAGLCAVATACLQGLLCADLMRRLLAGALQTTAGREGRLVCQSHAPPAGKRLTERGWQPPAGRAVLCADLMRRLWPSDGNVSHIRGGRGSRLCRMEEATSRATLWSPQKACQQAFAENLGNSPAWGADPRRRQGADPQRSWSADPHRSQSADPQPGADLGRGPPAQVGRGPPVELERGPPP